MLCYNVSSRNAARAQSTSLGSEVRLISAAVPRLNGVGEPSPMGRSVVNIKS